MGPIVIGMVCKTDYEQIQLEMVTYSSVQQPIHGYRIYHLRWHMIFSPLEDGDQNGLNLVNGRGLLGWSPPSKVIYWLQSSFFPYGATVDEKR